MQDSKYEAPKFEASKTLTQAKDLFGSAYDDFMKKAGKDDEKSAGKDDEKSRLQAVFGKMEVSKYLSELKKELFRIHGEFEEIPAEGEKDGLKQPLLEDKRMAPAEAFLLKIFDHTTRLLEELNKKDADFAKVKLALIGYSVDIQKLHAEFGKDRSAYKPLLNNKDKDYIFKLCLGLGFVLCVAFGITLTDMLMNEPLTGLYHMLRDFIGGDLLANAKDSTVDIIDALAVTVTGILASCSFFGAKKSADKTNRENQELNGNLTKAFTFFSTTLREKVGEEELQSPLSASPSLPPSL